MLVKSKVSQQWEIPDLKHAAPRVMSSKAMSAYELGPHSACTFMWNLQQTRDIFLAEAHMVFLLGSTGNHFTACVFQPVDNSPSIATKPLYTFFIEVNANCMFCLYLVSEKAVPIEDVRDRQRDLLPVILPLPCPVKHQRGDRGAVGLHGDQNGAIELSIEIHKEAQLQIIQNKTKQGHIISGLHNTVTSYR